MVGSWLTGVEETLKIATASAKVAGAMAAAPPVKAARLSKELRRATYSEFDQAVHEVLAAGTHLAALTSVRSVSGKRFVRTAVALISNAAQRRADPLQRILRGSAGLLNLAVVTDLLGDLQHQRAAYDSVNNLQWAVARFGHAVGKVRLDGAPWPQEEAEAVTVLIAELCGRVTEPEPKFIECVAALGRKESDFLVAARSDLARRFWHQAKRPRARWWEVWLPPKPVEPDWRPPRASEIIRQMRG